MSLRILAVLIGALGTLLPAATLADVVNGTANPDRMRLIFNRSTVNYSMDLLAERPVMWSSSIISTDPEVGTADLEKIRKDLRALSLHGTGTLRHPTLRDKLDGLLVQVSYQIGSFSFLWTVTYETGLTDEGKAIIDAILNDYPRTKKALSQE